MNFEWKQGDRFVLPPSPRPTGWPGANSNVSRHGRRSNVGHALTNLYSPVMVIVQTYPSAEVVRARRAVGKFDGVTYMIPIDAIEAEMAENDPCPGCGQGHKIGDFKHVTDTGDTWHSACWCDHQDALDLSEEDDYYDRVVDREIARNRGE